jgi:hypothetical protein
MASKIININYGTSGFIFYDFDNNLDNISDNTFSCIALYKIRIDHENKMIHYSDDLEIGKYNIGNIELIVKPEFYYNIHDSIYLDNTTFHPILNINQNNLLFSIEEIDLKNININPNTGEINIVNLNIGEYSFHVNLSIQGSIVLTNTFISFKVLPYLIYYNIPTYIRSSNEILENSTKPIVDPVGGTFQCIYPINKDGIINLNNLDIGSYDIDVYYTVNNITNSFIYSVTILSDLIYKNNYECFEFTDFSTEIPICQLGGIFSIEEINLINLNNDNHIINTIYYYNKDNKFEISNNGIITCNCEADNYELIIKYKFKNKSNATATINILVKPKIYYKSAPNSFIQSIYGTMYTSDKPYYCKEQSCIFSINNNNFSINEEGIITQKNLELPPDIYNILITYTKNNICVETTFTLSIIPFIELLDNKYEYFINEVNETKVKYLPIKIKFNEFSSFKQIGDINTNCVGKFKTEFIYSFNNQTNSIVYDYIVKPIIKYDNIIFKYNEIEVIKPYYVYPDLNGIFSFKKNYYNMFINSATGEIHLNNLDIGIYIIDIIYDTNTEISFELKIEPKIIVSELNINYDDLLLLDKVDVMKMIKYDLNDISGTFDNNILNLKDLDCGTYEYIITFNYVTDTFQFPIKINIFKSELKLLFTCINKTYDGNNLAHVNCNNKSITFEAKYTNEKTEYYKDVFIKIINFDNNNYFVKDTVIKGSILKKPITPIFFGTNKEYDKTTNAKVTYKLDNLVYTELVSTIEHMNSFFSTVDIGTHKIIIKNIKFFDKNYILDNSEYEINGTISPRKLLPNIYVKDKIYDNDVNAIDYIYFKSFNNLIKSDDIKIIKFDACYDNPDIGIKTIFIKNVILDTKNYIIEDFTISGKIIPQKIKLDLICIDKCYDGTNIAFIDNTELLKSCEATYMNPNIGNQKIMITNIQLNNKNIEMDDTYIYGNINPKLIDVEIICQDKYYDETTKIEYSFNTDTILNGSVIFQDENVGEEKEIVYILSCNDQNYKIQNIKHNNPSIFKKELIIEFISLSKEYDGTNTAFVKCDNYHVLSYESYYEDSIVGKDKIIYIKNVKVKNNNYFVEDTIIFGIILPKEIQLIAKGVEKIYDGTTDAEIIITDLNNCIDNVFIISYKANYVNSNIGCKIIIVSELDLGGKNIDCYHFKETQIIGNILAH